MEGYNIGYSKQKSVYVHVPYSERFPRQLFHCTVVGLGAQYCPSPSPPYRTAVWSMWICVKCQLAVVTIDSDTVGMLCKMPHISTNATYADMLYVYGLCDRSATAAAEEHSYAQDSGS
jgi:hypothetical protein